MNKMINLTYFHEYSTQNIRIWSYSLTKQKKKDKKKSFQKTQVNEIPPGH